MSTDYDQGRRPASPDTRRGAGSAAEEICENCGERNPVGSQFCSSCNAYLGWDTEPVGTSPSTAGPTGAGDGRTSDKPGTSGPGASFDPTEGRFRVTLEQAEVSVPATGEAVPVVLRLGNTSEIVDGYAVELTEPPPWLVVEHEQVRLLPRADEPMTVRMRVVSEALVAAQEIGLVLRVRSLSQAPAHMDLPIRVIVPALDIPIGLRTEPRLLRVRDAESAQCAVVVDNTRSNRAARVQFAGTDPELAVRFAFQPPVLEVRPGASARARLVVSAPPPGAGEELTRTLTVTADEGGRTVETVLTLQQATSARTEDPLVGIELEPSVVRVRDTQVGVTRVTLDNRAGAGWAHLRLGASDPERVVRVAFSESSVDVPPGRTTQVEARFEAPLPEVGAEVSRTVTVTAADGLRTSRAVGTFVQSASDSPLTTLAVRVEPSVIRVRDADGANVQVVVDNRRGRSGVRVALNGADPERIVRFTFTPHLVDVGPGQAVAVGLRLDSLRPEPGQEVTRPFTISATDGHRSVDAPASLVQTASRSAMDLLSVRLDPSVLRLPNRSRGSLRAMVDNRQGAQPVRITMHGDDPENLVSFRFVPPMLDIGPGQVATTSVRVRAPRAPVGQQATRPFTIAASDGRASVQAEGELHQSSSQLRPWARILFTLLGGLLMIFGSFATWHAASGLTGVELTASRLGRPFGLQLDLGAIDPVVSVGVLMIALGVLVIFGLTGPSGRLSRFAALLGALVLVALFVALALVGVSAQPAGGAVVVLLGCIAGYIGGALGRR